MFFITTLYVMKRNSENILIEWLVLEAQSGEKSALDQLVVRLYPKLLRYSFRQLNDHEGARDTVQSSFEILSKDLRKVTDPAAFLGWIYKITHRKGVDYIRRQQQQNVLRERVEHEQLVHEAPEASIGVDEQFSVSDILKTLGPEPYRLVHLYYLEGFSIKEIATILCIPEGTVKSRLFQARKQLKSYL